MRKAPQWHRYRVEWYVRMSTVISFNVISLFGFLEHSIQRIRTACARSDHDTVLLKSSKILYNGAVALSKSSQIPPVNGGIICGPSSFWILFCPFSKSPESSLFLKHWQLFVQQHDASRPCWFSYCRDFHNRYMYHPQFPVCGYFIPPLQSGLIHFLQKELQRRTRASHCLYTPYIRHHHRLCPFAFHLCHLAILCNEMAKHV